MQPHYSGRHLHGCTRGAGRHPSGVDQESHCWCGHATVGGGAGQAVGKEGSCQGIRIELGL